MDCFANPNSPKSILLDKMKSSLRSMKADKSNENNLQPIHHFDGLTALHKPHQASCFVNEGDLEILEGVASVSMFQVNSMCTACTYQVGYNNAVQLATTCSATKYNVSLNW